MDTRIIKLQKLIDSFANNLAYMKASKNNYNETSCRNEYIDSLLEILGWDITNKKGNALQCREVFVEYNSLIY